MGQLINPVSVRIGFSYFWKFNWCSFLKKTYSNLVINDILIYNFLCFFLKRISNKDKKVMRKFYFGVLHLGDFSIFRQSSYISIILQCYNLNDFLKFYKNEYYFQIFKNLKSLRFSKIKKRKKNGKLIRHNRRLYYRMSNLRKIFNIKEFILLLNIIKKILVSNYNLNRLIKIKIFLLLLLYSKSIINYNKNLFLKEKIRYNNIKFFLNRILLKYNSVFDKTCIFKFILNNNIYNKIDILLLLNLLRLNKSRLKRNMIFIEKKNEKYYSNIKKNQEIISYKRFLETLKFNLINFNSLNFKKGNYILNNQLIYSVTRFTENSNKKILKSIQIYLKKILKLIQISLILLKIKKKGVKLRLKKRIFKILKKNIKIIMNLFYKIKKNNKNNYNILNILFFNLNKLFLFYKIDRFYKKGVKIDNFFLTIKYNIFFEVLLFFIVLCEKFIIRLIENAFKSYFELFLSKFLIKSFKEKITLNLKLLQYDKYKLDATILKEYMEKKIKNNVKAFMVVRSIANILDYMLFLGDLKGYQVKISGRLTKNPRSRSLSLKGGKCEMGRGLSELSYSSFYVRTKTGIVGVKIWLNFGISNFKKRRNKRELFKKKEKKNMKFRIKYNT